MSEVNIVIEVVAITPQQCHHKIMTVCKSLKHEGYSLLHTADIRRDQKQRIGSAGFSEYAGSMRIYETDLIMAA